MKNELETTITTSIGACAVGYPGMLETSPCKYRGYVEFWKNGETLPYKLVNCPESRWDRSSAIHDAEYLEADAEFIARHM